MSGEGEPYECEICHGQFTKGRSDEEAIAEMEAMWTDTEDPGIVCDDCFNRVTAWAADAAPEMFQLPPVPVYILRPNWEPWRERQRKTL